MKFMPVIVGILVAWVLVICTQTALAEDIIARTVAINGVSALKIEGPGSLDIALGEEESLVITAPKSLLTKITVVGQEQELHIKANYNNLFNANNDALDYKLTLKSLTQLHIYGSLTANILSPINTPEFDLLNNGAAQITFAHPIKNNNTRITINGAGHLTVNALTTQHLTVKNNGAAEFTINGVTQQQTLTLNGAAEYHAYGLQSKNITATLNGASQAHLWVSETLNLTANGAADINYYGDAEVTSKLSGASELHHQGAHPHP